MFPPVVSKPGDLLMCISSSFLRRDLGFDSRIVEVIEYGELLLVVESSLRDTHLRVLTSKGNYGWIDKQRVTDYF